MNTLIHSKEKGTLTIIQLIIKVGKLITLV